MIGEAMIKFRTKFQFQIPFQFFKTVQKAEICDGNGQKLWQGPPFFQLSHLLFCFFMIEIQA